MSTNKKTVYQVLSAIDVTKKLKKKGKLDYLSWASAWALAKNQYPDLKRTVYETEEGINYFHDHKTAWVKVGVTINNMEHIDYLPIMNTFGKFSSKNLDTITSFDVNTTIQRSTVKALALHGLGLELYKGEDLVNIPDNVETKQMPQAPAITNKKPSKPKPPPTGDPLEDIITIKQGLSKRPWAKIEQWLRLTYDDLTIEQLKNKIDEQEAVKQ
jgi:hypothetical protein|tara:strand:+ start:315 stop:956 length:642 start_codon:yes stop_codon:yes gene_type:complete